MNNPEKNFGANVWLDDVMVPTADAKVNVMTHALHYGSSAFEGIRIYNYVPFKLEEHLQRFLDSASAIGMKVAYTIDQLKEACHKVIKANDVKNGYMRPLVWRGQGSTMVINGASCPIHVLIAAWGSFEDKRSTLRESGLNLLVSAWKKGTAETVPHKAKVSATYMMATMIKGEAESKGFDDAVILDIYDNITESSTSNLFFVKGEKLVTPIPDCFLDGLTRQAIIKEVAPRLGLRVEERHVKLDEIKEFDGAFVTGTATEITPVSAITHGDKTQRYALPNQIIDSLMQNFHNLATGNNA